MKTLDIQKIMETLPHQYPFLMVDRVIDMVEGEWLHAIKNVTINEPFFKGHFPGKPVMPGVLMLEALAQAAAILAFKSTDWKPGESLFYLARVENTRYSRKVVPGDRLDLKVEVLKKRSSVWKIRGKASVDGEVACVTELTSAEGKVNE